MSATQTIQQSSEDVEPTPLPAPGESDVRHAQYEAPPDTQSKGRNWQLWFKLISCGASFFVAGVNDGSLGALLPYIIRSYGLTTAIASSV